MSVILPNIPSSCKYICIQRRQRNMRRGENSMVSTKFERHKTGESLELLNETVNGVWSNINVFQENLSY